MSLSIKGSENVFQPKLHRLNHSNMIYFFINLKKERGMMTDRELLELLLTNQQQMQTELTDIKLKIVSVDAKVDAVDAKVDAVDAKVNEINAKVDLNYEKTLEFYADYKETITDIKDMLRIIIGQQQMHSNQISRNTSDINDMKKIRNIS